MLLTFLLLAYLYILAVAYWVRVLGLRTDRRSMILAPKLATSTEIALRSPQTIIVP
jgi:hypothetical protein